MKRTIHFVSGLPRSGSTLLCNILAQNPRIHVTPSSGIMEILVMVRNRWNKVVEFQAAPDEEAKLRVMRSILEGYHDDPAHDKPIVFDKSRGWIGMFEMIEAIFGRQAKVLVPVRDVRDVLASYEKLWRDNAGTWEFAQERSNFFKWQTLEGRCEVWLSANQPVGIAYNRIKDALARGFRDRMHFVEYEKLTSNPGEVLKGIYDYLAEPQFKHDFNNVKQVTQENDEIQGIPGLHQVRPKVEAVEPEWPQYLGKIGDRFARLNQVWRNSKDEGAKMKAETAKT